MTTKTTSGFACMECGHRFKTVAAAKAAAFGDHGCPKCGGSDIDLEAAPKRERCPDCGREGERKGHMTCAYPS